MKSKEYILEVIEKNRKELSRLGVSDIGLFGSYSRGDYSSSSDIDLLVDFVPGQETYDNLMTVCDLLEKAFEDEKVEVVTKGGLSPYIESNVLDHVVYI